MSNFFILHTAQSSGAILTRDTSDTTVLGVGDRPYGKVVAGSISVAGDSELGFLFYPVTASGPSVLFQLGMVLSYDVAIDNPIALWHAPKGALVETDAFAASGTGALVAGASSGNTAADSILGIINGKYVAVQGSGAGSVPRAKLIGNAVNSGVQCIRVQVL